MKRHFLAMRGIAILLVVLNHTVALGAAARLEAGLPALSQPANLFLKTIELLGWYAVPIFLFISGCFFAYAAQGGQQSISYRLVWSNLQHVIWPYIIWSLVFYGWLLLGPGQSFSIPGYAKNLLTGFPFHFVPLLVFFYLLSPILVWISKRIGWAPVLVVLGLYQVFLILLLEPGGFGLTLPGWLQALKPPVIAQTYADWGIYFPLGMAFTMRIKDVSPVLERWRYLFLVLTGVFFGATILAVARVIDAAWARFIYPLMYVLYLPSVQRNNIPGVRRMEAVGRRAYGLYLIHFTLINILYFGIAAANPNLLNLWWLTFPVVFLLAVFLPLGLMELASRLPQRKLYRYLFG
jgi:peptidoglycan/LPS O-acetylase OafA/YrhL